MSEPDPELNSRPAPQLVIDALTVRLGRRVVLEDVSASVGPGRLVTLAGPNAAGKTTLLRAVIGAIAPLRGSVLWNDLAVRSLGPRRRAGAIAYAGQQPVLPAAFTVRELVAIGRHALPAVPGRVRAALASMDLEDVRDRPLGSLSGGQRQRAALARAFAQHEPGGLLVLDEPMAGLDLAHVERVLEHVATLRDAGSTIVMAAHELAAAVASADELWLLDRGRLVHRGPAGDDDLPAVLSRVFGTTFEWARLAGGGRVLAAPMNGRESPGSSPGRPSGSASSGSPGESVGRSDDGPR